MSENPKRIRIQETKNQIEIESDLYKEYSYYNGILGIIISFLPYKDIVMKTFLVTKGFNIASRKSFSQMNKSTLIRHFFTSVRQGYIKNVEMILEKGVDPSVLDNFAIIIASDYGHTNIIKFFIKKIKGEFPYLHRAINSCFKAGDLECLKILISLIKKSDAYRDNYYRIITNGFKIACENGNLNIVKYIHNNKAGPFYPDEYQTALNFYLVCFHNHHKILKFFIKNDYNLPINPVYIRFNGIEEVCGNSMLVHACSKNYFKIFKLIVKHRIGKINFNANYCLRIAGGKGHLKIMKYILAILKTTPHINIPDLTPNLTYGFCYVPTICCAFNQLEAIKLFFNSKWINIDLYKIEAIESACSSNRVSIKKFLLFHPRLKWSPADLIKYG